MEDINSDDLFSYEYYIHQEYYTYLEYYKAIKILALDDGVQLALTLDNDFALHDNLS